MVENISPEAKEGASSHTSPTFIPERSHPSPQVVQPNLESIHSQTQQVRAELADISEEQMGEDGSVHKDPSLKQRIEWKVAQKATSFLTSPVFIPVDKKDMPPTKRQKMVKRAKHMRQLQRSSVNGLIPHIVNEGMHQLQRTPELLRVSAEVVKRLVGH